MSSFVSWDSNYPHFISTVLYFWYLMAVEESTHGCGDWSQHGQATLSELTCFLWLCLSEERLPKKDAASWGPHSGAFPSDPSLKASAAAEEIRHSRRVLPGNITTGRGRDLVQTGVRLSIVNAVGSNFTQRASNPLDSDDSVIPVDFHLPLSLISPFGLNWSDSSWVFLDTGGSWVSTRMWTRTSFWLLSVPKSWPSWRRS